MTREQERSLYESAQKRVRILLDQHCPESELLERLETYVSRKQAREILEAAKKSQ